MNNQIRSHVAEELLSRILLNAYLEEICVHSVQAQLVFFSDSIREGIRARIDVVFTCDARISETDLLRDSDPIQDFFSARAIFLARVHSLIGKNVLRINVQEDGALVIEIDSVKLLLTLSVDDHESDDWVWKVGIEEGVNAEKIGTRTVFCSPELGSVGFYVS